MSTAMKVTLETSKNLKVLELRKELFKFIKGNVDYNTNKIVPH